MLLDWLVVVLWLLASVTFLDSNLVVWGGSICHADAYGTSQLLEASSYPFLALLSCQQRNIEVLDRMEGAMPEEQVGTTSQPPAPQSSSRRLHRRANIQEAWHG